MAKYPSGGLNHNPAALLMAPAMKPRTVWR